MNNTKTIFKSLLIMIVAISLFTVSCSKDEGGTKTPTTPTIQKISSTDVETILKGLGKLPTDSPVVDFSKIVFTTTKGEATLEGESTDYNKVKSTLEPVLKKANFNNEKIELTQDATFPIANPTGSATADITLVFKAKAGYEFDTTITGGNKYTYDKDKKTATLTLNIKPSGNWEA